MIRVTAADWVFISIVFGEYGSDPGSDSGVHETYGLSIIGLDVSLFRRKWMSTELQWRLSHEPSIWRTLEARTAAKYNLSRRVNWLERKERAGFWHSRSLKL